MAIACILALMLQNVAAFASVCSMQSQSASAITSVATERCCHCDPKGPERECCKKAAGHSSAKKVEGKKDGPCKCEIRASDNQGAALALVTFPSVIVAGVLPPPIKIRGAIRLHSNPGIYGVDSGPPSPSVYAPDLGRAPPVA